MVVFFPVILHRYSSKMQFQYTKSSWLYFVGHGQGAMMLLAHHANNPQFGTKVIYVGLIETKCAINVGSMQNRCKNVDRCKLLNQN